MSRIGKQPVVIPKGIEVQIDKNVLSVKGPKGLNMLNIHPAVMVERQGEEIIVKPKVETKAGRAVYGLTRALIANMVFGVQNGFEKKLEIVGIGYKANVSGKKLVLNLGYSHPIEYPIPDGIEILVDKQTNITVRGIDKQKVGQVCAEIRNFKPPEPYKGKGIRYEGEAVRRKVGKSGA
ncbi:MAG: 50S ribosomal protein L6 [bacterium]|nr:50S ribosomal protein L6 [bacterium]